MNEERNPLETEPIGKLIPKYVMPTTLTLMVNYLYNIARPDICLSRCRHYGYFGVKRYLSTYYHTNSYFHSNWGYVCNFGAKNYDTARKTYKPTTTIAIAISTIWFVVYQVILRQIATRFISDSPMFR